RTTVMASSIHGLRLAERTGVGSRKLFWAMVLAIVVSLVASVWMTLELAYRYGGVNLNSWFFIAGPQFPYKWVEGKMNNPSAPSVTGWLLTGFGAAVMGFLSAMRQRFVGWPFHPVGFCVGSTWIMDEIWLTCFIAWLLKWLILRFGGLRWFRLSLPFFLGLIVGQYTCNGFWLVVDYFSGARGNQIFWI
ncbi:MAG: amiloride-sensitive sodium channel family protein, partial [Armatimonadetes bacterium]|nr:amiloride-sensitive sodium channel family protein [Armatimonadota bacterium]